MRTAPWLLLCSVMALTACGVPPSITPVLDSYTSVTPSATGTPNSVVILGNFEFVSVQPTGQIFIYNFSSGVQAQVGSPYATPCNSPSGMVVVPEGSKNIMAVACYDTDSVLTLNITADGLLTPLGLVAIPGVPYPSITLDGTNAFVPIFGDCSAVGSGGVDGGVAKLDVSNPAAPVVTGTVTLASPQPNGCVNATSLTVSGGYIYVASGSETASSSVQVVNESTMQLVGSPFLVPHSPQQIAVSGGVAYITLFDGLGVESINISNPASLQMLQQIAPSVPSPCHALALGLRNTTAYLGCWAEGNVDRINVSAPASMTETNYITGMGAPQSMTFSGDYLFVVSSAVGGSVYQIYVGPSN